MIPHDGARLLWITVTGRVYDIPVLAHGEMREAPIFSTMMNGR
jgi:hypothetical protein